MNSYYSRKKKKKREEWQFRNTDFTLSSGNKGHEKRNLKAPKRRADKERKINRHRNRLAWKASRRCAGNGRHHSRTATPRGADPATLRRGLAEARGRGVVGPRPAATPRARPRRSPPLPRGGSAARPRPLWARPGGGHVDRAGAGARRVSPRSAGQAGRRQLFGVRVPGARATVTMSSPPKEKVETRAGHPPAGTAAGSRLSALSLPSSGDGTGWDGGAGAAWAAAGLRESPAGRRFPEERPACGAGAEEDEGGPGQVPPALPGGVSHGRCPRAPPLGPRRPKQRLIRLPGSGTGTWDPGPVSGRPSPLLPPLSCPLQPSPVSGVALPAPLFPGELSGYRQILAGFVLFGIFSF